MSAACINTGRPIYQKEIRIEDEKYLAWIREQPCCCCEKRQREQRTPTEAAHTGDRAYTKKADDSRAVPVCGEHHQTAPESYHKLGRRKWAERHCIDLEELILEYNARYEREVRPLKR